MPTVLRSGPYRFFFYAGDRDEPPHVHVERDNNTAKFWLDPVRLQNSGGFSRRDINRIQKLVDKNREHLLGVGMNTSTNEIHVAKAQHVDVTEDTLMVDLVDGRTILAPIVWYPRLLHGKSEERNNWRWIGRGEGIHWPDLDEDISVENLLAGKPSGESHRSFKRWLEKRPHGANSPDNSQKNIGTVD